jgi:hypothetical protein
MREPGPVRLTLFVLGVIALDAVVTVAGGLRRLLAGARPGSGAGSGIC